MKLKFLIGLSLICLVFAAGCQFWFEQINVHATGDVITEERAIGDFTRVNASGIGELDITQGDTNALTIEADEAIMPYLTSEMHGDTLELGIEDNKTLSTTGTVVIRYHLTVTDIDAITLSGMMALTTGPLTTDHMELILSGSGNLEIETLTASSLDVTLSGMGNVTVSGEAAELTVSISGAGNLTAGELRSQTAQASISGLGGATLWVTDALNIHISGSGSVEYYGHPEVTQQITGLGRAVALGDK